LCLGKMLLYNKLCPQLILYAVSPLTSNQSRTFEQKTSAYPFSACLGTWCTSCQAN
jgi:hypothetical protein